MKRLLIFMQNLYTGGAERTVVNIINGLDYNKYEILLVVGTYTDNNYVGSIRNPCVKVKYLNKPKLRGSLLPLSRIIRKEKPNLMFTTLTPNNVILCLAKVLSFSRIPLVVRGTNYTSLAAKQSFFGKHIRRFLYNRVANHIVALSKGVQQDMIDNHGIKAYKIELIYNPIDINEIIRLSKKDLSIRLDDGFNIITVGRLVEQKNHEMLIEAFSHLIKQSENVNLYIIGEGYNEEKLRNKIKRLGLNNSVHLLGFQKNPYNYIRAADLFVLSSKWEGFGHVIVEAMILGVPIVSTNCLSGPSEILGQGEYGLLTDISADSLFNGIHKLIHNDKMRKELANKAKFRAQDFDYKKIVKAYDSLFSKL